MTISGVRIINVQRHIAHIPDGTPVRIMFNATEQREERFLRAGFPENAYVGATILPNIVGPKTKFNSEGKWRVLRDQPKESRYIGTRVWRWTTWGGEENERYVDIERECYPRELIPPPSMEISVQVLGDQTLIVSPSFIVGEVDEDEVKHSINVFLELFRECEIVTENLEAYEPPVLQKLNWRLLPPGEYPWEQISQYIVDALQQASNDMQDIIRDRVTTIRGYVPDRVLVGAGGFNDYLAYVFEQREIVVLESIRRGNALYVFGDDWEEVSRLTKAQILDGDLHQERIIHSAGWKDRLAEVLG